MSRKLRTCQSLTITALILLLVASGCSLRRAAADVMATPTTVSPTATPAAPVPLSFDEQAAARALQAQFIWVYESASPAVVNITTHTYVYNWFMQPIPQEGTGSGFVYDSNGHIVTNYHVVDSAQELLVTLAGGGVYEAEIVGVDPSNDLAVIRIDAGADLPQPLVLGHSDRLQVGQFVLAIGNPFGLQQTLTTGVISALGRVIESPEENGFIGEAIQTDAAINPGNSGGPLLDLEGYVIGVNSQIISTSGSSAGIGFAVSANTVQRVVPELIAQGYYPHAWLGADLLSLTPSTARVLREAGMNLPVDSGVLVTGVATGGPADKAGIRGSSRMVRQGRYRVPVDGDVIIVIDGQPVTNLATLTVYLEGETTVGDTVELTILRDGQKQVIKVQLGEQPRGT